MRLKSKITGKVYDFSSEALAALESQPKLKAKFEPVDQPAPAPTPPEVEALIAVKATKYEPKPVDPEDLIWVNDHKYPEDEQAAANKGNKERSKRSGL
jgi:hypothetical protein